MQKLIAFLGQNKNTVIAALSLILVSMSTIFLFWNKDLNDKQKASIAHSTEGNPMVMPAVADEGWRKVIAGIEKEQSVFVLNTNGELIHIDDDWAKSMEYGEKEMIGQKFFPFIKQEDLSNVMFSFIKALQNGETVSNVGPYRFKTADGNYRILMGTIVPVKDKAGKVIQLVGIHKDITETVVPIEPGAGQKDKTIRDQDEKNNPENRIVVEKTA